MAIEDAIHELRTEMREGFSRVEQRLDGHDTRFEAVEARLDAHDARFDSIDARFESIDARFQSVDAEFRSVRAEIKAEGEATRRHFDIVAEQMKDIVKVVAEGTARNTGRLDDHEIRPARVERKKR
jgi:septal ring factor EnvC (AmiA/AmiB activator)